MYVNDKNKISQAKIKACLLKKVKARLSGNWGMSKNEKEDIKLGLSDTDEGRHLLDHFSKQLYNLNEALIKGRSVWAECVKEPRNLDSGKHYFAVYYVTKDGQRDRIWARGFAVLCGQDIQDRDRHVDRYVFSSGVIGMSRQLDATDGLFNLLKACGGTYCQL